MPRLVKLRDVCHARSGDKGDTANIGVFVYDARHYPWLREQLTSDRVASYFRDVIAGPIERYELPKLGGLNFVLHRALGGGVSRSLMVDGHGKGYSSILLDMSVPAPPGRPRAHRRKASSR